MNPSEIWREAKNAMTADMVARMAGMLGCAPGEEHALAPFATVKHDDRWWLAAITTPCPTIGQIAIVAWEPAGEVFLIDPRTAASRLFDDASSCFVGERADPVGALHVYTSGLGFARAWARSRSQWICDLSRDIDAGIVKHGDWITEPKDGSIPGSLLCGDLANVTDFSSLRGEAQLVVDDPRMVRCLSDAMLRAARLPIVTAAPALLRAVA